MVTEKKTVWGRKNLRMQCYTFIVACTYVRSFTDHVIRIGAVSVVPNMMEGNCPRGGGGASTEEGVVAAEKEQELLMENQRQLAAIPVKLLTDAEQEVSCVSLQIPSSVKSTS